MRNSSCNLCSLGIESPKKPKTVCLLPQAQDTCRVMLVGESPGQEDDMHAQTFVSPGYRDVKAFFNRNGVEVYCTFAVKCKKPLREAKITDRHVKVCAENYLKEEIARVQPEHIIVLGAQAYYAATGKKSGFSAAQGTRFWSDRAKAWIYPTFHPAQVLYDRAKKEPFFAELRLYLRWILEGEDAVKFEPPVRVVSDVDALREMREQIFAGKGIVGVDTETTGLYPYGKGGKVRCIQFCWDVNDGGVFVPLHLEPDCFLNGDPRDVAPPFWKKDSDLLEGVKIIADILRNARCVWHNGKFDRLWLHEWGWREFGVPIVAPKIAMDTLHTAFLINENRPALGLKKLIVSDLGLPSYDIPNKLTKDLGTLIPYATKDTVGMMLLARKYAGIMSQPDMARVKLFYEKVLKRADMVYTRMELRGWPVDPARCRMMLHRLEACFDEVTEMLLEWLRDNKGITDVDTNLFASKAFPEFLYNQVGVPINPDRSLAYTGTGELSVSEDALSHLQKHPFVKMMFTRRKLAKFKSTYVEAMLAQANGRGSLSTAYKLARAVTGRTASGKESSKQPSSEGMNLQNLAHPLDLKKDAPELIARLPSWVFKKNFKEDGADVEPKFNIKTLIKSSDSDLLFWSCDFSQIELVIAAYLSRDPLLLATFKDGHGGGDLHAIRASRVLGITWEEWLELEKDKKKLARTNAKPVNFGYLYGMSWRKFLTFALTTYKIEFTAEEAQRFRDGFFNDHSGLPTWYRQVEARAKRDGYVETPTGRRRHLPNLQLDPERSREYARLYKEAARQAVNSGVQGFGSDLKLMAAIEIDEWLQDRFGGEEYGQAWREGQRFGYGGEWNNHAYQIGEVHDAINGLVRREHAEELLHNVIRIMRKPRLMAELGIEMDVPINAEAELGPSYGELEVVEVP